MEKSASIQKLLGQAIVAILATVTLSTLLIFWVLGQQSSDSVVINLAGRQRMLGQKMAKESLLLLGAESASADAARFRTDLTATMALFNRSIKALDQGDEELGVPATTNEEVRIHLKAFAQLWSRQEERLNGLLKQTPDATQRPPFIQALLADTKEMLGAAQEITQHYEKLGQGKIVRLKWMLAGSLLLILAISALAMRRMRRHMVQPAVQLTQAMGVMAHGDYDVHLPTALRAQELLEMAEAVEVFRRNGLEIRRMQEEKCLAEAAEAEERCRMRQQWAAEFEASVGQVVQAVGSAAEELQATAHSLSNLAATTTEQTGTVAAATEEGSVNLGAVAAAGDELAASIHEISRQVQISSDIARRAVIQGDSAHETINQLTQSMSRVGQVVALIKGVADKTNLLALNATIEAARAGEAGRGFAVVAEEVKQLASQTTHATEEIATQIHHMEQDMEEAVRSVVAIGDVIRENDSIVTTVAGAVEEQGATTREISRNVDEAALGTREISRSMGTLSHTAAENGQAAGHVLLAARDLGGHAITLQREMENFLTRLRES